jgi:acyl-coenzyme A synthetase/AMP-(fatty) acid ligase
MGEMTENKDILYHGRADDMMNAGGFRVSPLEVEAALLAYPDIQEVGVTDIEIKADTRVIAAYYVSDGPVDQAALDSFIAERLARYKQPRLYTRIASLPRNANNKLLRRALPDHPSL